MSCDVLFDSFPHQYLKQHSVSISEPVWEGKNTVQRVKHGETSSPPSTAQSIFSFHSFPGWKCLIIIGWIFYCTSNTPSFQKHNHLPSSFLLFSPPFPLHHSLQSEKKAEIQPVALPSLWRLEVEDLLTEKPITGRHSSLSCCKTGEFLSPLSQRI